MIVDVVDIRKRIQQVRNEVSDALMARREAVPYQDDSSDLVSIAFEPGAETDNSDKLANMAGQNAVKALTDPETGQPVLQSPASQIPVQAKRAHRAVSDVMSMPSFTLNVTNRHSSKLLTGLIIMQLVTNIILVALLVIK